MNIYCGTDIIEVSRIKDAIKSNPSFLTKVYSKNEISQIEGIKSDVKFEHYAGKFAAKEATYKAISKVIYQNKFNINFYDIEILNDPKLFDRPYVKFLDKKVNEYIIKKNIQIDVSISHIKTEAIAVAIVKIEEENNE